MFIECYIINAVNHQNYSLFPLRLVKCIVLFLQYIIVFTPFYILHILNLKISHNKLFYILKIVYQIFKGNLLLIIV